MSTKKKTSSAKGLLVRSVEERRNRNGYTFTSVPQFIDVQADDLSDEDVQAIQDDRYLMVVEVPSAPKGTARAQRRTSEGGEWIPGNLSIGNATLETATEEMVEAAKHGEQPPMHPSAPGGEPISESMDPAAVDANIERLQQQRLEGADTGAPRRRGRPAKVQPTAKNASGAGDKTTTAGKGTSPVNE